MVLTILLYTLLELCLNKSIIKKLGRFQGCAKKVQSFKCRTRGEMRTSCVKRDRTRLRLGWRQTAQTVHVARTGIELRSGFSSTSCNRAAAEERESCAPRTQMHKTLHRGHPLCQDHAMRRGQGHGCCCWRTDSVSSGARASFGESAARMQACKFQAGSDARVELSRWHWFLSSVIMQNWHALDKMWFDGCSRAEFFKL